MRFPQITETFIDSQEMDLILLVVEVSPLLVVSFYDASLGLLAFCLLMWATMPWAYRKEVDESVYDEYKRLKKEKASTAEIEHVILPYRWIRRGTRMFFFAGVYFLAESILDLANQAFPEVIPNSFGIIFWFGTVLLILAMFDSYRVLDYVLEQEVPEITAVSVTSFFVWALALTVLEATQLPVFLNTTAKLQLYGPAGIVYTSSYILSLVGVVLTVAFRNDDWTTRKKIAYALMTLPWITLGLWILGYLRIG